MTQPTPPQWIAPSGGVPGAPSPIAADQRVATIGLVALILAILDIVYDLWQLGSSAFSGLVMGKLMHGFPGGASPPAATAAIMAQMEKFTMRIMICQSVRMVLYLAASIALIVIAIRLRRGDVQALGTAKNWSIAAFVVVALSIMIQAVFVVPAQIEYQQSVMKSMPTTSTPSGLFEGMQMLTGVMSIVSLIVAAAVTLVWPIVLMVWAGKVQKELAESKQDAAA